MIKSIKEWIFSKNNIVSVVDLIIYLAEMAGTPQSILNEMTRPSNRTLIVGWYDRGGGGDIKRPIIRHSIDMVNANKGVAINWYKEANALIESKLNNI